MTDSSVEKNDGTLIRKMDHRVSTESFAALCSGATTIVKQVKSWDTDQVRFELFKDGITNHLLKCYSKENADDAVLIRVYGENTELFIDRKLELRNIQLLFGAGLCEPLYCAFGNGLCYGYFPGATLDRNMVYDPVISRLVARRLAKMHSIQFSDNGRVPQPSLFLVLNKYLQLFPTAFADPIKKMRFENSIPSKAALEMEIASLKDSLLELRSPVVFCHNDLLLKNIIYNKEKGAVSFIDYEYADYDFQAFDIGNHFCEFAGVNKYEPQLYPSQEFQLKWIREYLEAWYLENGITREVLEKEVKKLYIQVNKFSLAAHLFWGLWAVIQSVHSMLDFDFLEYAKERFDEYFSSKHCFLCLEDFHIHNSTS